MPADYDLSPYIGIPFEDRNCYELFRLLYHDLFDIHLPPQPYRDATRRETKRNADLMQAEAIRWIPVPAGQEKFGDAVLLYISGLPSHIGFVLGQGRMIHAQQKTFSVIANYRHDLDWRSRRKSFYRHPLRADALGQCIAASVPHGTRGDAADGRTNR
jgi:cell wall-associated NlpC family hydrolase